MKLNNLNDENKLDNIDKFLINGLKSINLEDCSSEDIKKITLKAKSRKMEEKKEIIKVYKMVASFIFLIISILGIYIYISNKDTTYNVIIQSNNDNKEVDYNEEKECIIYSKVNPDTTDSRVDLTTEEIYNLSEFIVIAQINEVRATNYDKKYEYQYSGEEGYTFVRTIGKISIIDSIKGSLQKGEIIEFRKKGGKIEYNQYLKYYEEYPNESRDEEMEKECQESISKGIDINDIYVDVSVGYKNINIEQGKTYLVYLTEKKSGYWLQSSENAIREYDSKNNTVLNNITGEWEPLNRILDYNILT